MKCKNQNLICIPPQQLVIKAAIYIKYKELILY